MNEFEFVESAGVPERLRDLDLTEGRITQIAAWMHQNISGADQEDLSLGQWLHAAPTLSGAAAEAIRRQGVAMDVFRMYEGSLGRVKLECEERFR